MFHDLFYLGGFLALGALILLGSRYLLARPFSHLLCLTIGLTIAAMAWFHLIAVRSEADGPVHYTVLTIAQYGVLALGFKLWFSLNYPRFNRASRVVAHSFAHVSLSFVIFAGYWLKTTHPIVVFLLYPLSSLSVALIAESIEEALERRSGVNHD